VSAILPAGMAANSGDLSIYDFASSDDDVAKLGYFA